MSSRSMPASHGGFGEANAALAHGNGRQPLAESGSAGASSTGPRTRLAITGAGLVTPFGPDLASSWSGIREGRQAARPLAPADFGSPRQAALMASGRWAGAPARQFALRAGDGVRDPHPLVDMVLQAADEAARNAGLPVDPQQRARIGCVIGTSKSSVDWLMEPGRHVADLSLAAACGLPFEDGFPHRPSTAVAARLGLGGPLLCPVAACATGLISLIRGAELVRAGTCDVVLAGSVDASIHPLFLSAYRRMGVLARSDDDPARACRPFDRRRCGFVPGEGAAVLVIERWDHALARGAPIWAEWLTAGYCADPAGMTDVDPQATSLAWLIRDVLRRAELTAEEIDYIALHGTATRINDVAESRAVHRALGPAAKQKRCSSLKGGLGHLLGAAGSVECAAAVQALREQVIPPTVNLDDPDPECDLDYTPWRPVPRCIEHVLKLSLGFGGHMAAAVLRRA